MTTETKTPLNTETVVTQTEKSLLTEPRNKFYVPKYTTCKAWDRIHVCEHRCAICGLYYADESLKEYVIYKETLMADKSQKEIHKFVLTFCDLRSCMRESARLFAHEKLDSRTIPYPHTEYYGFRMVSSGIVYGKSSIQAFCVSLDEKLMLIMKRNPPKDEYYNLYGQHREKPIVKMVTIEEFMKFNNGTELNILETPNGGRKSSLVELEKKVLELIKKAYMV